MSTKLWVQDLKRKNINMINDLREKYKLIDTFCTLAEIPSPSMHEQKVKDKILEIFSQYGIEAFTDGVQNVIAKIDATDTNKDSIALSAHMDVVGDDRPINIKADDNVIKTDGTRTLGADDKAGVAAAIEFAHFLKNSDIKHGGLEIIFTRDEEKGMYGISNLDFSKLNSRIVLVLDADKLGTLFDSGAGYTRLTLCVDTPYGGHSGIDINDDARLNAASLICELISRFPQGVVKKNEKDIITSINLGSVVAGAPAIKNSSTIEEAVKEGMTNIINTKAMAQFSVRSSDPEDERNLMNRINLIIEEFNKKYGKKAKASVEFECHLMPFIKSDDTKIEEAARKTAQRLKIDFKASSFHAGAETHIYSRHKNSKGETFEPYLLGIANINNMHSNEEEINWNSYLRGFEFLKEMFVSLNA